LERSIKGSGQCGASYYSHRYQHCRQRPWHAARLLASAADTIDATGVSGTILRTSGGLQVTHDATINGPGATSLTVDGKATFRVFHIFAANVIISGLTVQNGLGTKANFTDEGAASSSRVPQA
jgi:hypothetical protein